MTDSAPTSLDLAILIKETALEGLDGEIARLSEDRGRIAEELMELRMQRMLAAQLTKVRQKTRGEKK